MLVYDCRTTELRGMGYIQAKMWVLIRPVHGRVLCVFRAWYVFSVFLYVVSVV